MAQKSIGIQQSERVQKRKGEEEKICIVKELRICRNPKDKGRIEVTEDYVESRGEIRAKKE
jgi:hypothetical protein